MSIYENWKSYRYKPQPADETSRDEMGNGN